MRLLHLAWPHLALRLALGRDPSIQAVGPLILGGRPWDDGVVLDASLEATALGVRRGMPLGQAHRLAPEATFLLPDPDADAAAVGGALDALAAFSPGIAGQVDPADRAFGSIEVQVDGLQALWGPEPVLVGKVRAALAPLLPGVPRAGIAGTRFAAALAAATGPGPTVVPAVLVPPGADAAFLAPLPAAALTRDPGVQARLARFGLATIGAVAALPRSALVARFGIEEGARLHDRANGIEADPFRPRRVTEPLALALALDEPVAELEALRFVLRRLATALGAQLDARGEAAGRVRLVAILDPTFAAGPLPAPDAGLPTATIVQRLPEPTADPEAIERLLLERLEQEPPALPVARLDLELLDIAPAAGRQLALFTPQANAMSRLGWQLARFAVRFGEGTVGRVALADPEAPLPEARWTWHPVAADGTGVPEHGMGVPARGAS